MPNRRACVQRYPHVSIHATTAKGEIPRAGQVLITEANVAVDGADLSGTTALMHAISTKPYTDTEYAQMLLNAGANINKQNRFGCVAAHDIVMVRPGTDADTKNKAVAMLKWFVEHGGDVKIADPHGLTPMSIAIKLRPLVPDLAAVLTPSGEGGAPSGSSTPSGSTPASSKVGRNDKCPCGSSKKYKTCCGKV